MTANRSNGASIQLNQLDHIHEEMVSLIPEPQDTPETIQTRGKLLRRSCKTLISHVKEIVKHQAVATQCATYVRPADPVDGVERATVMVGDGMLQLALGGGLHLDDLVPGQAVEVSADSSSVTAADRWVPLEGDIMDVVSVPVTENGERLVEVESGSAEQRHRVRVSGFVRGEIEEGMKVRVHRGFLYEIVKTKAARDTDYIEECRLHVDPHDPSAITFEQIKGHADAVRRVQLALDRTLNPDAYPGSGTLGSNAYLLVGPPGQGKTLTVRAAAYELVRRAGKQGKVLYIRSASILNKWVGQSEQRVRSIFDQATRDFQEHGIYTLVAFEEADSLLAGREHYDGSGGVRGSITTTLLTYLDGAMPLPPGIMVLALTNFEGRLDKALLRAQRLGGGRRITLRKIPESAVLEIVESELRDNPALLDGTPVEEFVAAVRAANDLVIGSCVIGKEKVDLHGRDVQGGSSARGGIDAALDLLHEHLFVIRQRGLVSPVERLTPALLFEGTRRTLHAVLASNAGDHNLERAREVLGGTLVHPDEVQTLVDVRCRPLSEVPVPPEYDLGPMRALEVEAAS